MVYIYFVTLRDSMPTLEAPSIETFEPVSTYRRLGVGYISLRSPEGVQLEVSEVGAARIDSDPDIAPLLARMGDFIAEHGMYKATIDIEDREPSNIMRVAESRRESSKYGYGHIKLASVYHPDAAPEVVVKAYDYDRISAAFQFYLGAWLHDGLARASDGVTSPAQVAMFQAGPSGHRTAVMDYVPGKDLYNLVSLLGSGDEYEQNIAEVEKIAIATRNAVRQRIRKIMGWRGALIANDLRVLKNIIDTDPETVTPDNMLERELAVIDQPVIKKHRMAAQVLARYAPTFGNTTSLRPNLSYQSQSA